VQGVRARPFGWEACAGQAPDEMGEWCRVEETRPGGHNAKARLVEMTTERMMWSNDYPHVTSDRPHSWKTVNATFAGLPTDESHAILAGNAQRLLGLDV
jgi:predicted TIM-barrel fold metal-dependent hydrolase